ncbi:putative protein phosphatase 2C-like protein 44 isoform X3 [Impatiens glandulifera]|uniref:putative protein phosphatase 2C-like protein 44 isoform X3 n=1 Tax=Impatiens glandulifera TaxID=253017 RepID=UPI001FB13D48|nr:putative protein phosphatase 2C-like protein 44 isoform X3 [Impatiens glandulifera]
MSFNNSQFKLKEMPPPVSHGYHAVEWNRDPANSSPDDDIITVQREQIGEEEVWFFGIVDDRVGNRVSKHMQSNLFDNKKLRSRNSKEALRKAHKSSRMGSAASAIVINGKKLVMANMDGYRCLVCRDGKAYQLGTTKTSWLCFNFRCSVSEELEEEVMVGDSRIDSRTEFVILASDGIWEVMKSQEAVNLISHLEDPQEAAECLAKEALKRMSKINISCIVIRFNYHN